MNSEQKIVARWQTKGHDYLELLSEKDGAFTYRGNGQGGVLRAKNLEEAIQEMERPWSEQGAGAVTVLKSDRPSLKRVI